MRSGANVVFVMTPKRCLRPTSGSRSAVSSLVANRVSLQPTVRSGSGSYPNRGDATHSSRAAGTRLRLLRPEQRGAANARRTIHAFGNSPTQLSQLFNRKLPHCCLVVERWIGYIIENPRDSAKVH